MRRGLATLHRRRLHRLHLQQQPVQDPGANPQARGAAPPRRRLTLLALTLRRSTAAQLTAAEIEQARALLWAAFADDADGQFSEDDWQHALGGMHFLGELDGALVAHAAVVDGTLFVAGQPIRTGYVEAVAVAPKQQGLGHGTALMRAVNEHIDERYELGALGTGSRHFYERLGWQIWRG